MYNILLIIINKEVNIFLVFVINWNTKESSVDLIIFIFYKRSPFLFIIIIYYIRYI